MKIPTPAEIARQIPTVQHTGRKGYVGKPRSLCLEEGARAMAEAIRDAMRDKARIELSDPWVRGTYEAISDNIDAALKETP